MFQESSLHMSQSQRRRAEPCDLTMFGDVSGTCWVSSNSSSSRRRTPQVTCCTDMLTLIQNLQENMNVLRNLDVVVYLQNLLLFHHWFLLLLTNPQNLKSTQTRVFLWLVPSSPEQEEHQADSPLESWTLTETPAEKKHLIFNKNRNQNWNLRSQLFYTSVIHTSLDHSPRRFCMMSTKDVHQSTRLCQVAEHQRSS